MGPLPWPGEKRDPHRLGPFNLGTMRGDGKMKTDYVFCKVTKTNVIPQEFACPVKFNCDKCPKLRPSANPKRESDHIVEPPGKSKPDLLLSYWKNWAIVDGATMEPLVDFAPKPFNGWNLDHLCDYIKRHPEQALHDQNILERIAIVRELETKKNLPEKSFDRILRAMRIDRRKLPLRKRLSVVDLKNKIRRDLFFFLKILDRGKDVKARDAIGRYVQQLYPGHKRLHPEENWKKIYRAYEKVFSELTSKLTREQALHFLEFAAEHINQSSAYSSFPPRLLRPPSASWLKAIGRKRIDGKLRSVGPPHPRIIHRSYSLLYLKGKYVSLYRAGRLS